MESTEVALQKGLCAFRTGRELQSFVAGVERDKAAVVAGLTLPQNNGLGEGKNHKLKLMKRMGYGRAGFPLLREPRPPCAVETEGVGKL